MLAEYESAGMLRWNIARLGNRGMVPSLLRYLAHRQPFVRVPGSIVRLEVIVRCLLRFRYRITCDSAPALLAPTDFLSDSWKFQSDQKSRSDFIRVRRRSSLGDDTAQLSQRNSQGLKVVLILSTVRSRFRNRSGFEFGGDFPDR